MAHHRTRVEGDEGGCASISRAVEKSSSRMKCAIHHDDGGDENYEGDNYNPLETISNTHHLVQYLVSDSESNTSVLGGKP